MVFLTFGFEFSTYALSTSGLSLHLSFIQHTQQLTGQYILYEQPQQKNGTPGTIETKTE